MTYVYSAIEYSPVAWFDGESPYLSASNMNRIEQGVAGATDKVNEVGAKVQSALSDIEGLKESAAKETVTVLTANGVSDMGIACYKFAVPSSGELEVDLSAAFDSTVLAVASIDAASSMSAVKYCTVSEGTLHVGVGRLGVSSATTDLSCNVAVMVVGTFAESQV